LPRTVCPA